MGPSGGMGGTETSKVFPHVLVDALSLVGLGVVTRSKPDWDPQLLPEIMPEASNKPGSSVDDIWRVVGSGTVFVKRSTKTRTCSSVAMLKCCHGSNRRQADVRWAKGSPGWGGLGVCPKGRSQRSQGIHNCRNRVRSSRLMSAQQSTKPQILSWSIVSVDQDSIMRRSHQEAVGAVGIMLTRRYFYNDLHFYQTLKSSSIQPCQEKCSETVKTSDRDFKVVL